MSQVIKILNTENTFRLGYPGFAQLYCLGTNINFIIFIYLESFDKTVCLQIHIGCLLLTTGNNEWRTGFINQDGVDFIDQGEIETTQYTVLDIGYHVVTQIVKTKFRVGCICNITRIGCTLLRFGKLTQVQTYRKSKPTENLTHPLGVTFRQVFVNRNDMHTLTG